MKRSLSPRLNRPIFAALLSLSLVPLAACDEGTVTPTGTDTIADTSNDSVSNNDGGTDAGTDTKLDTADSGPDPEVPPTTAAELELWLTAELYATWAAESAVHAGAGPHFGPVRTFINAPLATSLAAGNVAHPVGSSAVKELYGDDDTFVSGYAVMVKVAADSAGGDGWYWYELYNGSTFADSTGNASCTGCHSAGQDFFRSPYPLQ